MEGRGSERYLMCTHTHTHTHLALGVVVGRVFCLSTFLGCLFTCVLCELLGWGVGAYRERLLLLLDRGGGCLL